MKSTAAERILLFADDELPLVPQPFYTVYLPAGAAIDGEDLLQLRKIIEAFKWSAGSYRYAYLPEGSPAPVPTPVANEIILYFGTPNTRMETESRDTGESRIFFLPHLSEIRSNPAKKKEAIDVLKPYLGK